ncbi:hypothetical protein D3C73_1622690 [compost metagenome]
MTFPEVFSTSTLLLSSGERFSRMYLARSLMEYPSRYLLKKVAEVVAREDKVSIALPR